MSLKWVNETLTIKTKVKQGIEHHIKKKGKTKAGFWQEDLCDCVCKGKEIKYKACDI